MSRWVTLKTVSDFWWSQVVEAAPKIERPQADPSQGVATLKNSLTKVLSSLGVTNALLSSEISIEIHVPKWHHIPSGTPEIKKPTRRGKSVAYSLGARVHNSPNLVFSDERPDPHEGRLFVTGHD